MSEHSINVRAGIALAVVLSLLAASAGPVTAANVSTSAVADELVVGSAHQDFGTGEEPSPQTLENLTIQGSGDDATVRLADDQLSLADGFEDGDTDEWSGDAGITAQTSTVYEGTYAGKVSSSTSGEASTRVDSTVQNEQGDTIVVWTRADNNGFFFFGVQSETGLSSLSGYEVRTNPSGGDFQLVRRDDGSSTTLDTGGSSSSNTWYRSVIEWETDGTINVNVYDTSGNQVASLSATDHTYTSGGIGYGVYNGDSWIDSVRISGQPAESGTYVSATHNISNAEAAAINITQASNVSVDAEVRTDGGTTLATDTFTSASNHTLNLPETSSSQLKTVLDITVTGEDPQFELADESILFTNHAPEADNLSPPDGTELTQSSVDFSVDVSDAEFPTAQGDSVTAELFVDGSSVGTQTVTSNQTVTISQELTEGGDHTYHWELSDSYGATTSTPTNTVTVPAELEVWDVNNDTLIDQGNATVTFFGGDNEQQIVEREVTNGTVSLAGLPTDTEFTVAVRADGYFTRQVIITSLYEQSRVWLLSKSVSDAVEVTFRLDDRTGEFANSDETQLRVQRPITINNTTEWRDVIGDDISATSDLATVLQNDQRYRLIIENDVQSRILGSYTPSGPADPEVIPIGRVNFQADTEAGTALDASLLNETSPAVRVMFRDPDQQATSLKYRITNTTEGANSTVVVANTTLSDPGAFTSVTEVLPQGTTLDDSTYLVELWAYQDGDLMEKQSVSVGQLSGPGDWTAGVNEGLLNLAGFVLIVSTGYGTANYKPELGALVAVIFGGALTLLNVVAIPHVILGFTGTIALIVNTADTT